MITTRLLRRWELLVAMMAVVMGWELSPCCAATAERVELKEQDGNLRIQIDGKLFTEYHTTGTPRPFLYPVVGPGGLRLTRDYPMKPEAPGEEHDHPHHRSLWFTHGEVNGIDFWSDSPKAGKIVHQRFRNIKSGPTSGGFEAENHWVAPDGTVTCTDRVTVRVQPLADNARVLDFQIAIQAGEKPLVFGDTKEGTMAIRLAESMRLKPNKDHSDKATGHIVLSTGQRDGETWGKRGEWCDYHGLVEGKVVGVAIMDHPSNPRHPTWWHVRDYGLFAANAFGIHDFENKPKGAGDMTIPSRGEVVFRYRFLFHEGDEKEGKVAMRFREYVTAGSERGATAKPSAP